MTDALRGPSGELRALPKRRASEHDDDIDTDALEVKTKDGTVFATVDPAPLKQIVERSFVEFFRGPLPPPDVLEAYERVVPGGARLLFDSFAQVQAHEQKVELSQLDMAQVELRAEIRRVQRGQYLGFAVVVVVMVAAFFLILHGHDWAGGTIASLDLVGLATIFVLGRLKERSAKDDPEAVDGGPGR